MPERAKHFFWHVLALIAVSRSVFGSVVVVFFFNSVRARFWEFCWSDFGAILDLKINDGES